jgi:hypothetical protein
MASGWRVAVLVRLLLGGAILLRYRRLGPRGCGRARTGSRRPGRRCPSSRGSQRPPVITTTDR